MPLFDFTPQAQDVSTAQPGTLLGWNYPPWGVSANVAPTQTAGTNGTLYFLKVNVAVTTVVTNLNYFIAVAGSGATVDHAFAGLCNSSGTVVATTADRAADSALTSGAPSTWTAPLSAQYTAAPGVYYALLLIYMNTAGTNPSLGVVTNGRTGNSGQAAGSFPVSQLASQTAIAGPYTLSSNTLTSNWFWVALS